MRVVFFVHSLLSDWNHGNAHFLRGVATELQARGHDVRVYEPMDAWSVQNLVADHGEPALLATRAAYPALDIVQYDAERLDLDEALDGSGLVIVHEWNTHDIVRRVGEHHARSGHYVLLFHDTHHRSVSEPHAMAAYDLSSYDGVLAFGEVIRERYVQYGWADRAWTWHEAADVRVFKPAVTPNAAKSDVVWIGNWGDDERTSELREFLIEPVRRIGVRGTVHGVRYPQHGLDALRNAGIAYQGWLPNYRVPEVFAAHRVTVHVPRRPYVQVLPGIPTIRPFEALACGIPLVSAPWNDAEGLFRPGVDHLVARDRPEMERHLRDVINDDSLARSLAAHGRETILARHTCAHRVDELLAIDAAIQGRSALYGAPPEEALTT
jgi:spore maturation protein CgeB